MSAKQNPLPECPDSPNCERTAITLNADSAEVHSALLSSLRQMKAHSIEDNPAEQRIGAVFRIPVFGWKDDVAMIYEQENDSTTVYIRSASRVGKYDFGVNARRVKRLISNTVNQFSDQ